MHCKPYYFPSRDNKELNWTEKIFELCTYSLQPPLPTLKAFVPTVGIFAGPWLSWIRQLRRRWLHRFVNPFYLKGLDRHEKQHDHILTPSSFHLIPFILPCLVVQEPALCHSDSAGQTGSPGPASATAATPPTLQEKQRHERDSTSHILTNTKEKAVNDKSPFTIRPRQEILFLLAADVFVCVCVYVKGCISFPSFCSTLCVHVGVSVCQQYHPNKVLIKSVSRVSYALLTEKFPPWWQACPYIPPSLPPSLPAFSPSLYHFFAFTFPFLSPLQVNLVNLEGFATPMIGSSSINLCVWVFYPAVRACAGCWALAAAVCASLEGMWDCRCRCGDAGRASWVWEMRSGPAAGPPPLYDDEGPPDTRADKRMANKYHVPRRGFQKVLMSFTMQPF